MKHYELFKFVPGADAQKAQHKVWKTLEKLDRELDWLNHPVIYPGCMEAQSDFDLMAVVELDGEGRLADYLRHPLTAKLEEELKDAVAGKAAFNHY